MPRVPDTELANELNNDPAGLGYKDGADWKPATQIVHLMCERRTQANPDPAPQIPVPFTFTELMGIINAGGELAAFSLADAPVLMALVEAQDIQGILNVVELCRVKTMVSDTTAATIAAKVQETQADPNHPATIPLEPRFTELWGGKYDNLDILHVKGAIGEA